AADLEFALAVLRQPAFRNVQPRHDLDAGDQSRRMLGRHLQQLAAEPVHPHAHDTGATVLAGLDVDIRPAQTLGLDDDAVYQLDDGRGGSRALLLFGLVLVEFDGAAFFFQALEHVVEAAGFILSPLAAAEVLQYVLRQADTENIVACI